MLPASHALRQPDLYWKQLIQLKAACECAKLYRNQRATWMHGVESLKAIASSASISGWVIWRDMAFIWAAIIAVSQLLDAVKGVFPFARHHKAASDLTVAMETIYIEAEHEWEAIHAGKMTSDEINDRRMKLRKLQLAAEVRHFPEGFNPSTRIKKVATKAAIDYIHLTFHMDASA